MNESQIIDFLLNRPGYLKEGKNRLALLLEDKGHEVSVEDCANALKKASEIYQKSGGIELKSTWIDTAGNVGFAYKATNTTNYKELFDKVYKDLNKVKYETSYKEDTSSEIVVTLADLHIGAFVKNLTISPDYNVEVIAEYLNTVAAEINGIGANKVRLILLGDLIESFTGMNHPNSWQSIEFYGADLVKIAFMLLSKFFANIVNLASVDIIAGNHDRYTSNNKEDQRGGISDILSFFLQNAFSNLPITWNALILSKKYDGIVYNMMHGHFNLSKSAPSDIILRYSVDKEAYNINLEGHWHTRRLKMQINNKFIAADNNAYRSYTCPSLFTGNFYNESSGYTSTPGFMIFWNNGKGKPKVLDITL